MVTGGVVEYDGAADRYFLPREHAAFLTRAARPYNIAVNAQFVPLIARLEDRMLECFEHGEGLPYEAYDRFHEVMAEASDQSVVAKLFDQILPLEPGLVERLERGIDVLDIGCGAGRAICALAERYPASRFTGIDLCRDAIAMANDEANRRGLTNVSFRRANFSALEATPRYDLITTFDAIHDQPDPESLMESIARLLRPDGVYLLQEPHGTSNLDDDRSLPVATFLYAISTVHCTAVSLGQGGAGLGTLWGERRLRELLDKSGFRRVTKHVLPRDIVGMFFVARLE
jgi:2-polyprenyl-3-methyl-5-hydroxy-6-metoxy-1,4-benzoquinol methylase